MHMKIKFELDDEIVAVINSDSVPGDTDSIEIDGEEHYIVYTRWEIEPQGNSALVNKCSVTVGLG